MAARLRLDNYQPHGGETPPQKLLDLQTKSQNLKLCKQKNQTTQREEPRYIGAQGGEGGAKRPYFSHTTTHRPFTYLLSTRSIHLYHYHRASMRASLRLRIPPMPWSEKASCRRRWTLSIDQSPPACLQGRLLNTCEARCSASGFTKEEWCTR